MNYGIKFMIKLVPTDKRLLKSSRVRKWIRECEKVLERCSALEKLEEKTIESVLYGYPLFVQPDGSVKVVRDFYKRSKNRT